MDKTLTRFIKKTGERIQINKIRNEKEVEMKIVEITAYKRLVADTFQSTGQPRKKW